MYLIHRLSGCQLPTSIVIQHIQQYQQMTNGKLWKNISKKICIDDPHLVFEITPLCWPLRWQQKNKNVGKICLHMIIYKCCAKIKNICECVRRILFDTRFPNFMIYLKNSGASHFGKFNAIRTINFWFFCVDCFLSRKGITEWLLK